jgi:outer membrane protein assembly factor BamA
MRARSLALGALLLVSAHAAADTADEKTPVGAWGWLNPARAPFISVPEIDIDPYSGTTLGLIPTFLITDGEHQIRRIIAPDVIYNPHFGYGARGRIYDFPSADTQWSMVGGAKERVESEFDAEYATGILRDTRWSFAARAVYDRSGIPRFFGIGNFSHGFDATNYTDQQEFAEASVGLNLTHAWQLAYTVRDRTVEILHGSLAGIESIERRFPNIPGLGENHENLQRVSVTYDTRDELTVPTRGMQWVAYAGMAGRAGMLNDSLYSVAGLDGRQFWPIRDDATLAAHVALRYMPKAHDIPFWALSSLGGDRSVIGAEQPLRAFGAARFVDRDSFAASCEYRHRVASIDAFATHIEVEVTPFVDVGRVWANASTNPFVHLHRVVGIGVRGIASPFVVGYVDVGFGSDGSAIFSGINYPF